MGVLSQLLNGAMLAAMLRMATPLIFGGVGGVFSERAGIMNLGIEQGKRVGEILNSLLDEVISGALENEHNALMQRAVELLG